MSRTTLNAALLAASLLLLSARAAHAAPGPAKAEAKAAANGFAKQLDLFQPEALRLAIQDLMATYPDRYGLGQKHLEQLAQIAGDVDGIRQRLQQGDAAAGREAERILALQRDALLANPLLDFDRLLLVRRGLLQAEDAVIPSAAKGNKAKPKKENPYRRLGLPQNWQGNCALPKTGFDNEIMTLSPVRPDGSLSTLFRPDGGVFVGDVDLHFAAARLLFSMSAAKGAWQVYELNTDGSGLRQVTPGSEPDVDNYDACYLPDGRILFATSANLQGVPCVGGSAQVANLALLDPPSGQVRMLTFEQDHDWCPTVMNNGRILYSRWEYTDSPHYFTRLMFHMNPDGTAQMEYYGSNSYWPNGMFYARPIPGHPTKIVGIVSGHHGVPRMGELVVVDPARGRREAEGAVQRIPGRGQPVEPLIADGLVNASWPKFLHPYPLSEKYFLVSCQPHQDAPWGLYLADVFDNLVLIKELPGHALFEPLPLRPTPVPPAIPDRVRSEAQEAVVYMADVYRGPGLEGIPRGTVKGLRVFTYTYAYQGIGGHDRIGVESGWDVKRILGTVPVAEDGSALFRVPANTPISVQPLDADGRAVQLMRSWFTAMPGEVLSCVGCHESQNSGTPDLRSIAAGRTPASLTPWHGPPRGFSFVREVQPVLDRHCAACHHGQPDAQGRTLANLADASLVSVANRKGAQQFNQSYLALHPFVRRPGPESDYHLLRPLEYHASTSELVQLLEKGHYGVSLDAEAWDRLVTWIDLNAPCHGTWTEAYAGVDGAAEKIAAKSQRRAELARVFGNEQPDVEVEAAAGPERPRIEPLPAGPAEPGADQPPRVPNWPFPTRRAQRMQAAAAAETRRTVELAPGVAMEFVLIPAGDFVMGNPAGLPDERPAARVKIDQPFWLGVTEVSNAQFQAFRPQHDSGYIDQQWKDHNSPGYPANLPQQPAVRVSWEQALAFCQWLSARTGQPFTLPTEAQWEWACRAGTATACWYGEPDADFTSLANLADKRLTGFAVRGVNPQPVPNPDPLMAFLPRVDTVDDGQMIAAAPGGYRANPWGLMDMHGNVAEWTRTAYRPYPYTAADGREDLAAEGLKVVRGGSWRDRPQRATSSFRAAYQPYQAVFDVGFRVAMAETISSNSRSDGPVAADESSRPARGGGSTTTAVTVSESAAVGR